MDERGEKGPRGDRGERGERGESGVGWEDYRRLVVHQLEDLSERIDRSDQLHRADHERLVQMLSEVQAELAALKVKASFFGAISGLGAALAVFAAQIFGAHFR